MPNPTREAALTQWLRETSREAFRLHHSLGHRMYGPEALGLTPAMLSASVKLGKAGTLLQDALNGLKLAPRKHDGSWWSYDPIHDSDTGPYTTRQEAQAWINEVRDG